MKAVLITFLALLPLSSFGQTPTLVQSHALGRDNTPGYVNFTSSSPAPSYTNPQLKITLPQPSLSGNCLVLGVGAASVLTIGTPTDDKSNTWSVGPTVTSNGFTVSSFYTLAPATGTSLITVSFTGTVPTGASSALSHSIQEFANCGTIGPTGAVNHVSPLNVILSGAPNYGDLVWVYGEDAVTLNSTATIHAGLTSAKQGTNFTLADVNLYAGKVTEYSTSTTSTTVGFTVSDTNSWNAVALTIHAGSGGTIPTGMRIVHEHGEWSGVPTSEPPLNIQFPSTGNLIVGSSAGFSVASISSSPSNTWNLGVSSPSSACCTNIFYAANASTSTDMIITIPTFGSGYGTWDFVYFYDVAGASSSPHDVDSTTLGDQTSNGNLTGATITPTEANELLFNITTVDYHSMNGTVTDGNGHKPTLDLAVNTKDDDGICSGTCSSTPGVTPAGQLNDDDGRAHILTTDTKPITFIYTYTPVVGPLGVQNWHSVTSAFKPQAQTSAAPQPPTGLTAVVQ